MSALAKQRAAIDFCRTHPGQAFDEGMYEELQRWGLTQSEVTPSTIVYLLENLWERGREELRLLGLKNMAEAFDRISDFSRVGISGVLWAETPVLITGIFRQDDGRAVTWFQATEEFNKYVETITRLMIHEMECFGEDVHAYSVCVHPQTEKWFRIMGLLPDGSFETLPNGRIMRRFVRKAQ